MSRKRSGRERMRYRGGLNRNSDYQAVDPDRVGFGDLLQRKKSSRQRAKISVKKLSESLKNIRFDREKFESATDKAGSLLDRLPSPLKLNKKQLQIGGVIVLLLVIGVNILNVSDSTTSSEGEVAGATESPVPDLGFTALEPIDGINENDELFDIDEQRGIVSFVDDSNLGSFTITQQELPFEFKQTEGGLKNLALSLSDKEKIEQIETTKGVGYVVEQQNGDQRAMVADEDRNVLVFIVSKKLIPLNEWINYIDLLQ